MNKGNFFATLKLYLVSRFLAELSAVDVGATGKFYFKVDVYKECTVAPEINLYDLVYCIIVDRTS